MIINSVFINRWAALLHDILWIPVALLLAFWVRFNLGAIPEIYWEGLTNILLIAIPIQVFCYWYFGLYRGIWRFASIPDLVQIVKAVVLGVGFSVLATFILFRLQFVPRSILILYPLFLFLGLSIPRLMYRWYKDHRLYLSQAQKKAIIIGAGRAGEMLVRDMLRTNEFLPIGFLDDSKDKISRDIHGVRVLDFIDEIEKILNGYEVHLVVIAIRNVNNKKMRTIIRSCSENNIECRIIPNMVGLDEDNVNISQLREIKLDDLLGRKTIKIDGNSIKEFINHKTILVTGAGGSIGSELCHQIADNLPKTLILLEQSELNLYRITKNLNTGKKKDEIEIISLLSDIRDEVRISHIFEKYKPNIVVHAAAYKHVPILEENILEGVKTNILGTSKLAEIASRNQVEKFVMVSTDKAVNPTSIMGATKRIAEIFCQSLNSKSSTEFVTTRFGNVLDSTGSVVPLFKEQIEAGGPVTVTHKDISRYFMSIPEASSLILQAATMGEGGEIFVLDMGKPVKIYDLARQMIRLSGYDPDHDIQIEIIGLRPGEKLYEELFHESEEYIGTDHPKILLAESRKVDFDVFALHIKDIIDACDKTDIANIISIIKIVIPEYENSTSSFIPKGSEISSPGNLIH